jgi:chromatin segregation and condensation protein Rec8/ScpA/Scc1 (kleisin family)
VLELVRRGRVLVSQTAAFDDITLVPAPPADVAHAS